MKKALLLILAATLIAASCKKTIESEQKAWETNQKRASQLIFEYPSFTNVIKEQIAVAQKMMDEAATIADEKTKIQKMSDANSQIMITFVRNLEEIKSLKNKIRDKATEARGLKTLYNETMMMNQAISESERAVYNSDMKLQSVINTRMDADAVTGLVMSDLRMAESTLDRVIAMVKDREKAEQEKIASDKAEKEKQKTQSEATITCKYCGTVNLATAVTCKSCGAPLK